jgi:hypothetical protein
VTSLNLRIEFWSVVEKIVADEKRMFVFGAIIRQTALIFNENSRFIFGSHIFRASSCNLRRYVTKTATRAPISSTASRTTGISMSDAVGVSANLVHSTAFSDMMLNSRLTFSCPVHWTTTNWICGVAPSSTLKLHTPSQFPPSATSKFSSWPEDNRDQRVFLFTPGTINDFFDGYNSGNCDFEALTSLNVTLSSGETVEYLDVAEGGNCDGVCSFNVELGATPQIQFVVVQCTGQEKVSLEFSIMSENAVECTKLAETPTASLMLIPVVLLAVLDIGALVAVFVTYRRKLQLEALKI